MQSLMPCQSRLKNLGNFQYVKTWEALEQVVQRLNQYVNQEERPRLALDVETYWTDGRISEAAPRPIRTKVGWEGQVKTIQIGLPPDVEDFQYVIDVEILEDLSSKSRQRIADMLRPILEKAVVLGQEIKYEFQFMWALYKIRLRNMRCTKLINQVLNAGDKSLKSDLGTLYDNYMDPHFFKEYTGLFQKEYKEFKKTMQKSRWRGELSEEQIIYAAHDVSRLIFELYDRMTETHEERSIDSFIALYEKKNKFEQSVVRPIKLEWAIIPTFAMMELRGMQYDLNYHNGFVVPYLEKLRDDAAAEIYKYFPPKDITVGKGRGKARQTWVEKEYININSGKHQMLPALRTIGIDLPNYQEETIQQAGEEIDHPIIKWIIQYRKASGFLSKYGYAIQEFIRDTGRIYPSWFQIGLDAGIATGRSTAQDPPMMTIPIRDELFGMTAKELCRKSFISRPGYTLIDADYSQIEPRIMASLSQDEELLKVYQEGSDVDRHSLAAMMMFDLDYLPGEDDPMRAAGKEFNLGESYGMGLEKMTIKIARATKGKLTLSIDEMREKKQNYSGRFKGLKRLKDTTDRLIKAKAEHFGSLKPFLGGKPIAIIQTEYGRPRRWLLNQVISKADLDRVHDNPALLEKSAPKTGWFNIYSSVMSKISREAFNFSCGQGHASDIFKLALRYMQEEFDRQGFDFDSEGVILVLHDEVLVEVKEENKEKAKTLIKECMIKAAYELLSSVEIKISVKEGRDWANAH
jgi:DNA polymerase I-like protein with 3'-5' exonuclease and polymerase domains